MADFAQPADVHRLIRCCLTVAESEGWEMTSFSRTAYNSLVRDAEFIKPCDEGGFYFVSIQFSLADPWLQPEYMARTVLEKFEVNTKSPDSLTDNRQKDSTDE